MNWLYGIQANYFKRMPRVVFTITKNKIHGLTDIKELIQSLFKNNKMKDWDTIIDNEFISDNDNNNNNDENNNNKHNKREARSINKTEEAIVKNWQSNVLKRSAARIGACGTGIAASAASNAATDAAKFAARAANAARKAAEAAVSARAYRRIIENKITEDINNEKRFFVRNWMKMRRFLSNLYKFVFRWDG